MKKKFDIGDFVNVPTQQAILDKLIERVKTRRKELNFTQKVLAQRSGVSYASLRRFETMGEISLSSLMKLAQALDCLEDFNQLFKTKIITSLKDYNA